MPKTALANGFSVRTYQVPPASFDLDKASDRERAIYGIPRCSVAFRDLAKRWEAKARQFRIVEPVFRPREIRRKRLPGFRPGYSPETSTTWSGGIVFPSSVDRVKWVEGTWTMPNDSPPAGAKHGIWYTASTWIGIDGDDGSGDVLQAGCDADVMTSGGALRHQFNPWWEWYPAGSFWITTMLVSPGEELTCLICVHPGSTTAASIFLGNVTTSVGCFFSVAAPPGIALLGNCAEWIVEALETYDNMPKLAKYTKVKFAECRAGTVGGYTVSPGSGSAIDMVDSSNVVISKGQILGKTEVQVSYVSSLSRDGAREPAEGIAMDAS